MRAAPHAGSRRRRRCHAVLLAVVLASRCPRLAARTPRAVVASAAPVAPRAVDDAGYWAFADRMQPQLDRHWNERAGVYRGCSAASSRWSRRRAAHLQRRRRRATRARAQRPPGAPGRRRSCSPPAFVDEPPATPRDRSHARLVGLGDGATAPAPRLRLRGRRRARTRGSPAASSACRQPTAAIRDRIHRAASAPSGAGRSSGSTRSTGTSLVYAADATVTGSPRRSARHAAQIERFVARARGPAAPSPGTSAPGCASTTCRTSARAPDEHRLGRVREHRGLVPARLRAGAPRRAWRRCARRPRLLRNGSSACSPATGRTAAT